MNDRIREIKARLEAVEPYIRVSSLGVDLAYLLAEVERLRAALEELMWAYDDAVEHDDAACFRERREDAYNTAREALRQDVTDKGDVKA